MRAPGPLLAAGRDADVFEYGPGLVLRRARSGRSMAGEARVMAYAREHGFPAPAVEDLSDDGRDLVMERVDGPDMATVLRRRLWTIRRQGAVLAAVHRRLHAIAAPDWLAPVPAGDGPALVHMDFHPLNVLLGPKGPVVIDWADAGRGDPATDVAVTWTLLAAGQPPAGRLSAAVAARLRGALLRGYLEGVDVAASRRALPDAVAWKVRDANMSPVEQAAMRRLVEAEGREP